VVGAEEDWIAKNNGTAGWIRGVVMPFTPPTSTSIAGGAIIGVAAKEVDRKVPLERQSTVDGLARLLSRLTET
jgi:hypothetical protein